MTKTFNFYCDESTHLENDGHRYMILGYVSTSYNQLKKHNQAIREIKRSHFIKGEMKWRSISKSRVVFYAKVVEYFFMTDLEFRAIIIDKTQLNHSGFNQTHDEFYDKMYFQLLNKKIQFDATYNIYIDEKDTHSYKKAQSLKQYLERDYHNIRTLQAIKSYESELMQMADLLMGAINYKLRGLSKVASKNTIIEKIEKEIGKPIIEPSSLYEKKFNKFFIDLK
ncbi:DUF3800 domain-containing protein [Filimonas effusa]|uniref:DUF3800 domain-containing protein n=1 Tax=Filimonas effusa TaxID=2508721 RepID=A0A4Q1D203_9BACT|nr:DUF3800 domain-containing protein [Filimonas effusa]RXK81898.1 DUF3800 domain-containing protein [Filimonas effusa]